MRSILIALTLAPGFAYARGWHYYNTHATLGDVVKGVVALVILWGLFKLLGITLERVWNATGGARAWIRDFLGACRRLFTNL